MERHDGIRGRTARPRRAFTIIELLIAFVVIIILMSLLVVGGRKAILMAKSKKAEAIVSGLQIATDQFKTDFGFLPPLVRDNRDGSDIGPLDGPAGDPATNPVVYSTGNPGDVAFLRGDNPGGYPDRIERYSVYSLAYYLRGELPEAVDGVAGPGFLQPQRDGSFRKRQEGGANEGRIGTVYEPLFSLGSNSGAIAAIAPEEGRIELQDEKGAPLRYYRWLPDAGSAADAVDLYDFLNVPGALGTWEANPELKSATYAILSAGPDGKFETEDDVMGVGQ